VKKYFTNLVPQELRKTISLALLKKYVEKYQHFIEKFSRLHIWTEYLQEHVEIYYHILVLTTVR